MKYAVCEEGVEALKTMASAITEAAKEMKKLTEEIQAAGKDNEAIGLYKASLDNVIAEITSNIQQANRIAEILDEVAEAYQKVIDNDGFQQSAK